MRHWAVQIGISTPYGVFIFGISPFVWNFLYKRMTSPVHGIFLSIGPLIFAITDDRSVDVRMEDVK